MWYMYYAVHIVNVNRTSYMYMYMYMHVVGDSSRKWHTVRCGIRPLFVSCHPISDETDAQTSISHLIDYHMW